MEPLIILFVHVLIWALVFALLYWIVTLICSVLPAPMANTARVILLVLLALIALTFLLGEFGLWGEWGFGYHAKYRR
jgi:hypothetical protein